MESQEITPKEREILDLIGAGLSSREIALRLNKSFHTVTTQRKKMLKKLQAGNAAQLIKKSMEVVH